MRFTTFILILMGFAYYAGWHMRDDDAAHEKRMSDRSAPAAARVARR